MGRVKVVSACGGTAVPMVQPQPLSPPGGAPLMALAKRIKFNLRCHLSGVHLCHVHTLKFRIQKVYKRTGPSIDPFKDGSDELYILY
jgi:hypothetical protein